MNTLKSFDDYLKEGLVRKITYNVSKANFIILEAQKKKLFLNSVLKNLPSNEMNPNFIIDYCYDIILEHIRAKLLIDGFNVGNSHEAEISYAKKLGFSESDILFLDELRYNRNGTKYYGRLFDIEYAKKVLKFLEKIYPKLQDLVN